MYDNKDYLEEKREKVAALSWVLALDHQGRLPSAEPIWAPHLLKSVRKEVAEV